MSTILIIEDEKELREGLAELLSFEGYDIIQAANGLEGIRSITLKIPDLVLCDIKMPGMDGFEVLYQLKMHDAFIFVPFIFISILKERNQIRKGMASGADDYLTKPFSREELLMAITSRLEKSSRQELIIQKSIGEIESSLDCEIPLNIKSNNRCNPFKEASINNQSFKKNLYEKGLPAMQETVHVIEANNTIKDIKIFVQKELLDNCLPSQERKQLLELQSKIERKTILSDNLTVFQLKFNQLYPHFIAGFSQSFPTLTQYELMLASAMIIGLDTHQIADLLNISSESVKKSRYRLKKKLGLKKEDDLLKFIHSYNLTASKIKPNIKKGVVPVS